MSSSTTLRFSVTHEDRRASVWSLVAPKKKPEVYIFNKFLGSLHVSFHASGSWHTKFGDIEEKRRVHLGQNVTDGYLQKWQRPEKLKPHVTLAFRIITPWGSLRKPKGKVEKPFVPVTSAQPGHSTEILILFVDPGKELEIKNAELIGSFTLCNGEQVVVVHNQIPTGARQPQMPSRVADFTQNISLMELFTANLGTIVMGDASDGSKVMWDIAIRITPVAYIKIFGLKTKKWLVDLFTAKKCK